MDANDLTAHFTIIRDKLVGYFVEHKNLVPEAAEVSSILNLQREIRRLNNVQRYTHQKQHKTT